MRKEWKSILTAMLCSKANGIESFNSSANFSGLYRSVVFDQMIDSIESMIELFLLFVVLMFTPISALLYFYLEMLYAYEEIKSEYYFCERNLTICINN